MSLRCAVLPLLLAGCGPKEAPVAAPAPYSPDELRRQEISAFVKSSIDTAADPCTDFYQFACGRWLANTPLPPDRPAWGRSFSEIQESNRATLRTLLDSAAKGDPVPAGESEADWKKMGDFYGSCMDEAAVDAAGLTGVQPLLDAIDGIKKPGEVMSVVGRLHVAQIGALFGVWVEGDFKNPRRNIMYLAEGGLGLPDRDYYLEDDEQSVATQAAYRAHIAEMLALAGADEATASKQADAIYAFEHAIAEHATPKAGLRDLVKVYNKIDRVGLEKLSKGTAWQAYFAATGGRDVVDISVDSPDYHEWFFGMLARADLGTVKAYLRYHTLSDTSFLLPKAYDDADFGFYGRTLYGQQEQQDRWKRCVSATDAALPEIVGRFYVTARFTGDSKDTAKAMVGDIFAAYEQALPELAWMDEPTRAAAVDKMKQVNSKIGYPDKWRDYSAVSVSPDTWAANALAARSFESQRQMAKIGKDVDPAEWLMSASMVNAYYNPLLNEIAFPAGILQPPFFSGDYPSAMNFGAIGMVIGHELSHGFDDQGRQFDGTGTMKEWWAPEVSARFEERAQCVDDAYSAVETLPGLHINGKLTLGENIADMGGIKQAYRAWQISGGGAPTATVDGLTDEQLLFVAYAQGWCTVMSPEYEKMLVVSNPHSPPKARVNLPLQHFATFSEAFSCPADAPMNPSTKCEVW